MKIKNIILVCLFIFMSSICFGQSFKEIKKSAEQGNAYAQYNLGVMYHEGEGTLKNYKKALYWHKKSAEQGNAYAQYSLGEMYHKGEGTLKNYKKALYWLQKSAEQGISEAQFNLAIMYYDGNGVLKNYKKSAYWMRKAYKNGNLGANEAWNKLELWKYE